MRDIDTFSVSHLQFNLNFIMLHTNRFHPDKQAGKSDAEKEEAETKFKALGEAYDCLSDPEKRSRYDQGVEVEDIDNPNAGAGGMHHGGGMHGIDPNIIFEMFMRQQMGGRGGMGGGMHF